MSEIVSIDPKNPEVSIIKEAAMVIKKGGVVAYPTSSFYALGVDAFNSKAIDKVYKLKQRDPKKPILILIGDLKDLFSLVKEVPNSANLLIDRFWPGGLTIVFEAANSIPINLTGNSGKVAIRLDNHRVVSLLANISGTPITGTSANISGRKECLMACEILSQFEKGLDLILDAGPLSGGRPSTIIDITLSPPRVLREGMIDIEEIEAIYKTSVI